MTPSQPLTVFGFMLVAFALGLVVHVITAQFAGRHANHLPGGAIGAAVSTAGLSQAYVHLPIVLYGLALLVCAIAGHLTSCLLTRRWFG